MIVQDYENALTEIHRLEKLCEEMSSQIEQ